MAGSSNGIIQPGLKFSHYRIKQIIGFQLFPVFNGSHRLQPGLWPANVREDNGAVEGDHR